MPGIPGESDATPTLPIESPLSQILEDSAITRVDRALCELARRIEVELNQSEETYRRVRATRMHGLSATRFAADIGAASRECSAADIPYADYQPVMETAKNLYAEMFAFKTVPLPPTIDISALLQNEYMVVDLQLGHSQKSITSENAWNEYMKLRNRLNSCIGKLVSYRDAVFGKCSPSACLPTESQVIKDSPPKPATPNEGGNPSSHATTDATLPVLLSASDIANRIKRNPKSVSSFLTRLAEKNPDCRIETESKRKNEPGYLYRTAEVWPAIKEWMKDRAEN